MALLKKKYTKEDLSLSQKSSLWSIRRDIPLTILGWFAVLAIIYTILNHIGHSVFLVAIAAILAYALIPAVQFFTRFVPKVIAVIFVYTLVMFGLSFVIYLTLQTAIEQGTLLIRALQTYVTPQGNEDLSPLIRSLYQAGFNSDQIAEANRQIATQLEQLTSGIIPFINGFFTSVFDIFLITVLSIYLLLDGERIIGWLKTNMPISQKSRLQFLLNTLQRIVGGYIRGQFLMAVIIGVLVGLGMFVLQVQYPVLLGLFAFILAFIPILGTFISGAACIIVALTNGWLVALFVLIYFTLVHIFEGDYLSPRIVGKALGLHPVISILAVITGAELFGMVGALFAAPIAGVTQAFLVAVWTEWKMLNPQLFAKGRKKIINKATKLL